MRVVPRVVVVGAVASLVEAVAVVGGVLEVSDVVVEDA